MTEHEKKEWAEQKKSYILNKHKKFDPDAVDSFRAMGVLRGLKKFVLISCLLNINIQVCNTEEESKVKVLARHHAREVTMSK